MSNLKPFSVVFFPGEKSVSLVSSNWLSQSTKICRWPPVSDIETAIKKHRVPALSWAKIQYKFIIDCDTYDEAQDECDKAQTQSNVDTSASEASQASQPPKRKKKRAATSKNAAIKTSSSESEKETSDNEGTEVAVPKTFFSSSTNLDSSYLTVSNQYITSHSHKEGDTGHILLDPYFRACPAPPQSSTVLENSEISTDQTERRGAGYNIQELQAANQHFAPNSNWVTHPYAEVSIPKSIFGQSQDPNYYFPNYRHENGMQNGPNSSTIPNSVISSQLNQTSQRFDNELLTSFIQEHRRFQAAVIAKLKTIEEDVKDVLRATPALPAEQQSSATVIYPQLPCETIEDLAQLNTFLETPSNKNFQVRRLSLLGGKSAKDITSHILKKLLSSSFADKLSLTGKGKKANAGLKDTPVIAVIYDSVRNTKGAEGTSDFEVNAAIQAWLKNAPDRGGGREKRRKSTTTACSRSPPLSEQDDDNE